VKWNKTYSIIALAKSAMERIPLHSWEIEFSIQYHVTINSQLNDQNSIKYYINYIIDLLKTQIPLRNVESRKLGILQIRKLGISEVPSRPS
jgi:hypothetical protein